MSQILCCTYCKQEGHSRYYCDTLKEKNRNKRKEQKWNRLINTWGHDTQTMQGLYEEGDSVHGLGFRAYMDNINIYIDYTDINNGENTKNVYDILNEGNLAEQQYFTFEQPNKNNDTPSSKPRSLIDIMREQANGIE
jgi:hypothetical protein